MVRSVLAHPQRLLTDVTLVTPKCVKKTTGATYMGGSDQKEEVNKWLADVAGGVFKGGCTGWALLLETQRMTTLRCMKEGCELEPERCVVPNPSKEECGALKATGCHTYEGTSHGLLHEMTEGTGGVLEDLTSKGFKTFDIVWLDYCGTLMTAAGRKRQTDILHLFRSNLLSERCLLAITFCVRGSRNMYRDQVADVTKKLVFSIAKAYGVSLSVSGTVTYSSKSGPIHTLAFVRGVPRPTKLPVLKSTGRIIYEGAFDRRATLLTVWAAKAKGIKQLWEFIRDTDWRCPTPHYRAVEQGGRVFGDALGSGTVFALDTGMLPVTKYCQNKGMKVDTVLEDMMDAEEGYPHTDITNNHVAEMTSAYDGVWLSYLGRKAYPAKMLRKCHEWGDLRNLLQNKLLGSTLGLAIPYVSAVEPWEGCCTDWVVHGVQTACRDYSHPLLHPVYASSWVLGTPHMIVVFSTDEKCKVGLPTTSDPEVKRWENHINWDLNRAKRTTFHGIKFKALAKDIQPILSSEESCVICEPGVFYLAPLYSRCQFTAPDELEMMEARRKGFETVAPTEIAAQNLVVLTNEGSTPFALIWMPYITSWLNVPGFSSRLLVILVEVSHHQLFDDLLGVLSGLLQDQYEATVSKHKAMMHAARRWELVSISYQTK
eukprot:TRINITY_DN3185_c0_g4_i1.p1 TRINITY_DN3185_c0_g4~~TRINITY_DN3185_c0_g4_i1.p1  ORF type:complete len:673 (+),score=153.21 TRINITY_DN3185_c0_g4_i1:56-2020(+)